MEHREHFSRRFALIAGAMLVAALLLTWSSWLSGRAHAVPHPTLNFSMAVPGYAGCTTAQGDAQCFIPPGTTFPVNVTLDPLPSDIPGYEGYDIRLVFSGVTSLDNASTASWPDCGFPAAAYETPGVVQMGCAIGIESPPSTYSGLVGTNEFTCAASGTITMEHGGGATDLIQDVATALWEDQPGETLTIACGSPPTPTVPATATVALPTIAPSGSAGSQDAGHDTALWLVIGSIMALSSGLIVLGWTFARSR